VSVPPFDARGLLPPFVGTDGRSTDRSPYATNMVEIVASFGSSPHRSQLLKNLIAYRALLASDGYQSGLQFIDGSFVENVEAIESRPPADIDVFSFLNLPVKYTADPALWAATGFAFWQSEIADFGKNRFRVCLDTYAISIEGLQIQQLIQAVIYWYSLFSHRRATHAWKGFVAIPLDPAADHAALTALGGP
jgi:hypothetical protein